MKTNTLIRRAVKADAEQIVKLGNAVWRIAYAHIMPQEVFDEKEKNEIEKIEQVKDLINKNGRFDFVAEHNGKVVGFAIGTTISGYEHYKKLGYADLMAIYLYSEYQKMGIGKMLFDKVVAEFRKLNCKKMVVGVLEKNMKARKAYEKWGGQLDTFQTLYLKNGIGFPEVFYVFDL